MEPPLRCRWYRSTASRTRPENPVVTTTPASAKTALALGPQLPVKSAPTPWSRTNWALCVPAPPPASRNGFGNASSRPVSRSTKATYGQRPKRGSTCESSVSPVELMAIFIFHLLIVHSAGSLSVRLYRMPFLATCTRAAPIESEIPRFEAQQAYDHVDHPGLRRCWSWELVASSAPSSGVHISSPRSGWDMASTYPETPVLCVRDPDPS